MTYQVTKGWCNRHQKHYALEDCPTSSRGHRNREFYLCPDCVNDNYQHVMSVQEVLKKAIAL